MRSYTAQALALLVASASVANARITIKNSCSYPVYVKESNAIINQQPGFACDMGPNKGPCPAQATMTEPWTVQGGSSTSLEIHPKGATSVKISKDNDWITPKVTQFEYNQDPDKFWWDVSDIDGDGRARAGSPFFSENVMAWTDGDVGDSKTCIPVKCKKNEMCKDAYQFPDQKATHSCPAHTNDFTMEFCVSDADFDAKQLPQAFVGRRSVSFVA
ncbi:Osmotin, thaumatin-like protein [Glarea lozoyensis ATCC 20868]|uniref:Osmotin, thaumatin-like protein n=1 Tax=Glarea lozoyensis (strain ATCC 20868 / MF5171) TaxID=1116229 RepID=S3CLU6_GLAL2|nr:Osmotin, thaumatin-like protein [Glarea lozoyensis ATCC 20868]EPE26685.1 Osmotin, thaumatin-like protein [Glarea lozoyensis ATCC 20868]